MPAAPLSASAGRLSLRIHLSMRVRPRTNPPENRCPAVSKAWRAGAAFGEAARGARAAFILGRKTLPGSRGEVSPMRRNPEAEREPCRAFEKAMT